MSPLRKTLAAHLGQVLTPEVAAEIERTTNTHPEQPMDALNRWRHLIEPVIQDNPEPVAWADLQHIPVQVYEADQSVLVVRMTAPVAFVWVAAGVLREVLELFEQVMADARKAGCRSISYLGRAGWMRAAGFQEIAVYGVKEV